MKTDSKPIYKLEISPETENFGVNHADTKKKLLYLQQKPGTG
jgi:hypothetical protein